MPFFISILAILFLVSCSSQDSEKHFQKTLFSSSSDLSQPADSSVKNSAPKQTPVSSSSEQSSSSQRKYPLSVKNASESGEHSDGETVGVAQKKFPSSFSNVPNTVIGNLRWMTKNVNIPTPSGSLCYGKKNSNCKRFGRLYDFKTAREICPDAWRLPTDAEWTAMIEFLGENAGEKLKAKNGWASDDESSGNGTDSVQFHALPSGIVYESDFMYLGHHAYFWTATERDENTAYYRSLSYDSPEIYRYYNFKTAGYAVRCVQDAR